MISSLDDLSTKCIDRTARNQIDEAIRCYHTGSYRASIVTTYVAVCFDLIEKLKALAALGDKEAKTNIDALSNLQEQDNRGDPAAIGGLLEFERSLLEKFRDKFDFFGRNEFDELSRLRSDRNRCAHPTFFKSSLPFTPSAELARLHIRNALVYVLTQPPRQGKAALESLQETVLSKYFPQNREDAVSRLRNSDIQTARPPLINSFIDSLCFGWPDNKSPFYLKKVVTVVLKSMIKIHPDETIPRMGKNINKLLMSTDELATEFGCVLYITFDDIWNLIEDGHRPTIKRFMQEREKEGPRGSAINRCLNIPWLRSDAEKAVNTLTRKDFSDINSRPDSKIISASAKLLGSSKDTSEAEENAAQFAIKYSMYYQTNDLEVIFLGLSKVYNKTLPGDEVRRFIFKLYNSENNDRGVLKDILEKYGFFEYVSNENNLENKYFSGEAL